MHRRSKLDIVAIRESIKVPCPHCRASLGGDEYTRIDGERLKCKWCDGEFIPPQKGKTPMRTS